MLGVSIDDLWVDYLALGGQLMPFELEAFLSGLRPVDDHDHDLIVQALNERFLDLDADHPLAYADELATAD
jgi:DNA replication protein DnaD